MKSNAKDIINKRLVKVLQKTMKDAPKVLGNEGQKLILDNFKTQSYEGKKWQAVKNKKKTLPILIGRTRRLIGAVRRSYKGVTNGKLKWSIDGVIYAAIHNNGGSINKKARKATQNFRIKSNGQFRYAKLKKANFQMDVNIGTHTIKIPKRQFIGKSTKFVMALKGKFEQMIKINLKG